MAFTALGLVLRLKLVAIFAGADAQLAGKAFTRRRICSDAEGATSPFADVVQIW